MLFQITFSFAVMNFSTRIRSRVRYSGDVQMKRASKTNFHYISWVFETFLNIFKMLLLESHRVIRKSISVPFDVGFAIGSNKCAWVKALFHHPSIKSKSHTHTRPCTLILWIVDKRGVDIQWNILILCCVYIMEFYAIVFGYVVLYMLQRHQTMERIVENQSRFAQHKLGSEM